MVWLAVFFAVVLAVILNAFLTLEFAIVILCARAGVKMDVNLLSVKPLDKQAEGGGIDVLESVHLRLALDKGAIECCP